MGRINNLDDFSVLESRLLHHAIMCIEDDHNIEEYVQKFLNLWIVDIFRLEIVGKCPTEDDVVKFNCRKDVVDWLPVVSDLDWYPMYCSKRQSNFESWNWAS